MTSAEVPALVHCRSSPFSVPSMSRLVNARGFLLIRTLNSNPLLVSRLSLRPSRRSISSPSFAPLAMASSSQTDAPSGVNGAPDAFQLIRAHQEAAARLPPVEEIRTLLDRSVRGVLSTISQDHEGYPSGSMVDFACDDDGSPILAVSSLAVHSKNLVGNPKCSLLVAKDPDDRTDTVVTVYGDAISVSENDKETMRTAYLRRHPDAFWVDFGDFRFIHIKPKYVRYVSGVATALLGSGEFDAEEYKAAKADPISQFSVPVTSHMNKDHAEDSNCTAFYLSEADAAIAFSLKNVSTWPSPFSLEVDYAYMLDLDSLGFNVKAGYSGSTMKLRIPFPRCAEDRKDVKTLIVEMLQAAKASSSS